MTPWVGKVFVVGAVALAAMNGWNAYRNDLDRAAREGRTHAVAAYRIDPDAADALVGAASERCLRDLQWPDNPTPLLVFQSSPRSAACRPGSSEYRLFHQYLAAFSPLAGRLHLHRNEQRHPDHLCTTVYLAR